MSTDSCSKVPDNGEMKKKRRKRAALFFLVALLLLVLGIILWIFVFQHYVYTDDAYVEGNQIYITPLRPGFITAIHTDDTFLVKKGQLLIELDTTDSEIALAQAQQNLANEVREICQAFHQVFAYKAEIESRKAELIRTAQDFKHREDVLEMEGVSLEDFEHAVAALRVGYFSLKTTESLYDQSLALVRGTSIKNHPRVLARADHLRNMWVQLYRTKIYAPVEGLVAQRKIQVGMYVEEGQPLMSVIPLDQIWVNANYKETQMKEMRIGQKVRITSDLYGWDVVFNGVIVGLPGAAGNAFSLLPPQNLSGNWIKIVQRLPVRVRLDPEEIKRHPLRIGLSLEAIVDLRDQEGPLVPTTSEGAPFYDTSIFQKEEIGDQAFIEEIIDENLDPALLKYIDKPPDLQKAEIDKDVTNYLSRIGII
ncbi:MAG: efflux RND transporter periplasmic adaptor subunit [Chlamydiales bacterium]